MLALRLPEDVEERLAAVAKATGRSKSYYAREAIVQHLDDLEDIRYRDISRWKQPVTRGVPWPSSSSAIWKTI